MNRLLVLSKCLLALAGAALLGTLAWLSWQLVPLVQDARIGVLSANLAIADLNDVILGLNGKIDQALSEVKAARQDISQQLAGARDSLDRPLAASVTVLNRADRELALTAETLRVSLGDISGAAKSIPGEVSELITPLQAIADAGEKSVPPILRNVQRLTADASVVTRATVKTRPPWYIRLLGFTGIKKKTGEK